MYTDRSSSSKSSSLANSLDRERLLSEETIHEKAPSSISTTASRRNGRIKFYLHVSAVVIYAVIAAFLYAWSVRIGAAECGCDEGSVYSPANVAVKYETQTVTHKLANNKDSKFRGPPRPEVDEAWADLLEFNNIRVQAQDLHQANLTSVPLNDSPGGYLASLSVFHTLHCINKIRQTYYSDYYTDPNPLADQQEHFDHCIDMLRQTIMCHGDVALHPYEWKEDYRWPWPSEETVHQCRNWDGIMGWARENAVEDLTGDILMHPTLGPSFRGDEPHPSVRPSAQASSGKHEHEHGI